MVSNKDIGQYDLILEDLPGLRLLQLQHCKCVLKFINIVYLHKENTFMETNLLTLVIREARKSNKELKKKIRRTGTEKLTKLFTEIV